MTIDLAHILYNGVNGISELDMMRCMSDKVSKSVSKCTKKNTNQSISKPRVSE
jgi:hypothetical protein